MKFKQLTKDKKYILRIEKGKEVVDEITNFCKQHHIKFAEFSGIGAIKNIDYGIYEDGKYFHYQENDLCELISINGNVGYKKGESFVHAHAMMCKGDTHKTKQIFLGGHLFSAIVGVTVEIFLTTYHEAIERKLDKSSKLNVLDVDESMTSQWQDY